MSLQLEGGNVTRRGQNVYYISNSCNNYSDCEPVKATFSAGLYKIECWGASTNDMRGAYVKGNIYFPSEQVLYLYIGMKNNYFNAAPRSMSTYTAGFPGGATDIRIINGSYDSFDSLKSRIMVAAGPGGVDSVYDHGGEAGALEGFTAVMTKTFQGETMNETAYSTGGTQTSGGIWENCVYFVSYCYIGVNGSFGVGGLISSGDVGGVGGGGYYTGATRKGIGTGGGGSSFISGHEGCDAIFENSTVDNILHSHQPIHYSGLRFGETVMKGGNETKSTLQYNSILESGEGYVRITLNYCICTFNIPKHRQISFSIFILCFITS